ncbi:MAG TPA: cell division ATP-binding protein FtsE [Stellaceae bacterium]|nr:cell division ATP-binding protein FtsE [Stellaceae bacterium]
MPWFATMIRFENVGLRYGSGPEVLRDIHLKIDAGTFHFLTGPSGAGKSSLLKLIYMSERPSRGLISLFDRQISALPRRALPPMRRRIGVIFQDFRLINHLSIFDNVALPLRVAGESEDKIKRSVTDLLTWVGLAGRLQSRPATLSGGQQQRVAMARAVIGRPSLLLADEPTGNVDDEMAYRLLRLLEEMNRLGTTVIVATHNQGLAGRMKQPRLHLEDGQLTLIKPGLVPFSLAAEAEIAAETKAETERETELEARPGPDVQPDLPFGDGIGIDFETGIDPETTIDPETPPS